MSLTEQVRTVLDAVLHDDECATIKHWRIDDDNIERVGHLTWAQDCDCSRPQRVAERVAAAIAAAMAVFPVPQVPAVRLDKLRAAALRALAGPPEQEGS